VDFIGTLDGLYMNFVESMRSPWKPVGDCKVQPLCPPSCHCPAHHRCCRRCCCCRRCYCCWHHVVVGAVGGDGGVMVVVVVAHL
jgi:hypothetical protein